MWGWHLWLYFFIQFEIFLVLDMVRGVCLKPGHFCIILWGPGFLWHGSDGEEGCCLFTARLQQKCRFLTQSLRTPWGGGLAIAGRGGSPDFPLDLLWHHFREEWKDASLLSGADQSPESPCGLYRCRRGGGRTHYCLVGRWVSALCLSFFDTILTGLLGCLITTSQEWMSRLPTWPSLAWMGMGPQIF